MADEKPTPPAAAAEAPAATSPKPVKLVGEVNGRYLCKREGGSFYIAECLPNGGWRDNTRNVPMAAAPLASSLVRKLKFGERPEELRPA